MRLFFLVLVLVVLNKFTKVEKSLLSTFFPHKFCQSIRLICILVILLISFSSYIIIMVFYQQKIPTDFLGDWCQGHPDTPLPKVSVVNFQTSGVVSWESGEPFDPLKGIRTVDGVWSKKDSIIETNLPLVGIYSLEYFDSENRIKLNDLESPNYQLYRCELIERKQRTNLISINSEEKYNYRFKNYLEIFVLGS